MYKSNNLKQMNTCIASNTKMNCNSGAARLIVVLKELSFLDK